MTAQQPPPAVEVEIYLDLESLSQAAARSFLACARRAVADAGVFCVALSGGTTPRRLYQILASPPLLDQVPWRQTHLFWSDERGVPADAPESNYGLAARLLLQPGQLPAERIHPMEGDADDLEAACTRYQETLRRIACTEGRAPFCLDLVLLGMGADGHTASLLPGSGAIRERDRLVVVTRGGSPITDRMTLTLAAINRSRRVMVLLAGAAKAAILARVLTGEPDPNNVPATGLAPRHGTLVWMVDRAAAAALPDVLLRGVTVRRADVLA